MKGRRGRGWGREDTGRGCFREERDVEGSGLEDGWSARKKHSGKERTHPSTVTEAISSRPAPFGKRRAVILKALTFPPASSLRFPLFCDPSGVAEPSTFGIGQYRTPPSEPPVRTPANPELVEVGEEGRETGQMDQIERPSWPRGKVAARRYCDLEGQGGMEGEGTGNEVRDGAQNRRVASCGTKTKAKESSRSQSDWSSSTVSIGKNAPRRY